MQQGQTLNRDTFTAIQDLIYSQIEAWGNRQGNDQLDDERPASPLQQSGDIDPQATIQPQSDIETPRKGSISTQSHLSRRSSPQIALLDEPAREGASGDEVSEPTSTPDQPGSYCSPVAAPTTPVKQSLHKHENKATRHLEGYATPYDRSFQSIRGR